MTAVDPRYRFAGNAGVVWLGLPLLPVVTIAVTVAATVAALYVGAPLPVAVVLLVAGTAVALLPVSGRALVEWLPPSRRHGAATTFGATKWTAPLVPTPSKSARWTVSPAGRHGRLTLLDVDGVALVDDPAARVTTAVLAVAGSDRFALLDPPEQARLLAGWGDAIAALAADPRLRRIQWMERASPERDRLDRWLTDRGSSDKTALADYQAMVAAVTGTAARHEVFLALAYARPRTSAGGDTMPAIRDAVRALLIADLAARPLTVSECAALLRCCCDVGFDGTTPLHRGDQVGPASHLRRWDHLRTDDTVHRSFAVTGWPRVPVAPGWLEPLLLATPPAVTRTMAVHLVPVPQAAAVRQARAARSRARLDAAERTRFGLSDTAAVQAAADEATAAEEELVAGYRLTQMSAVVTCSAATVAELDDACRAVRTAAAAARLDLRPCHGEHDLGLLASMPLCRPSGRPR